MSNNFEEIFKSKSFNSWQLLEDQRQKLDQQGFCLIEPNQLLENGLKKIFLKLDRL